MRLIDWHGTDPTPGQQLRVILAHVHRSFWVHVAWACEEAAWHIQYLLESIRAAVCRLRGLPDPRDRHVYDIPPAALRYVEEVDA